jgi:ornithine--oxo-acid transaminase
MFRHTLRRFATTTSRDVIQREGKYSAHNYHPLPVVFARASGVHVYDPEGRQYYDFLSAYSAVNQGHCHPRIVKALVDQAQNLTLSSRAFYSQGLGTFAKFMTELFQYDSMLPMNTGAEAVETAVKLARRWGYRVKGIPHDKAIVVSVCGAFHGRTQAPMALSCDPQMTNDFGPLLPGIAKVAYDDADALDEFLQANGKHVCAFIVEPIQGEAGVFVPHAGYLRKVREICTKHNVLMIADEIQTGIARTGKMLAVDHEHVKADLLVLGKAVAGGVYPVSCVLANKEVMDLIRPGDHGSTFGGNPLGTAVALEAMKVVLDEKLAERSEALGKVFRNELSNGLNRKVVEIVRGKGLLNAIVVNHAALEDSGNTAWELCLLLAKKGLLAKPTHENIIRLAPPLVISEAQLRECVDIIKTSVDEVMRLDKKDIHAQWKDVSH